MKILIVEDTQDLNRNITMLMQHEGYEAYSAFDGAEALEYIKKDSFDCIILDIMMPKVDGLTVLKEIRKRQLLTPVLLLTAKAEVEDRVIGLDSGADDYLPKPFAFKELLARIRALLRRQPDYSAEVMKFGDVTLDGSDLSLGANSTICLSLKEFEVMRLLMANNDIELSTDYLLGYIWKNEPDAGEDTVWLYISYLNRKLSMIDSNMSISGEKGTGYRLVGESDE
jgi:DNA-binding response OmpR family regulator